MYLTFFSSHRISHLYLKYIYSVSAAGNCQSDEHLIFSTCKQHWLCPHHTECKAASQLSKINVNVNIIKNIINIIKCKIKINVCVRIDCKRLFYDICSE